MPAEGKSAVAQKWTTACNSYSDPASVADTSYRWGVNIVSRGGVPRTRPGMNCYQTGAPGIPKGMTIFTPNGGIPYIVAAVGSQILTCPYPFNGPFTALPNLSFPSNSLVNFELAIQSITEADDGTLTVLPVPNRILMIFDGMSRTAYWDGIVSRHLDPTKKPNGPAETPVFQWGLWNNQRFWGSLGSRMRASNYANPLKFTEEDFPSEGGALVLPDSVTGIGQTPDFKTLLAYTDTTTTSIASNIFDRTTWQSTQGFQTEIFPNIGCAAGKSIVIYNNLTWWYSHGGMIALDQAFRQNFSSRVHFQDQAMNWSKGNLSSNIGNICAGTFENYMLVGVPSGDIYNAHTWVMDQAWAQDEAISDFYSALRAPTWNGIWTGIRPVEIVTAVIKGRERVFALSYDLPPTGSTIPQANVWELFIRSRVDSGFDQFGAPQQKRIDCSLETKVMLHDENFYDFRYILVDIADIAGVVNLKISFAPLRGGYKLLTSKQIVASQWSVFNGQTTIVVGQFNWNSFRPQSRVVRSENDLALNDAADSPYEGVESELQRQTDRGFSVLIEWTGQMSVRSVRLTADPGVQKKEGEPTTNELTDRHVQMSGIQEVDLTTPPTVIGVDNLTSSYVTSTTREWVEHFYQSLT